MGRQEALRGSIPHHHSSPAPLRHHPLSPPLPALAAAFLKIAHHLVKDALLIGVQQNPDLAPRIFEDLIDLGAHPASDPPHLLMMPAKGGSDTLHLIALKAQVRFKALDEADSSSALAETGPSDGRSLEFFMESVPPTRKIACPAAGEKHNDENSCRFSLNSA